MSTHSPRTPLLVLALVVATGFAAPSVLTDPTDAATTPAREVVPSVATSVVASPPSEPVIYTHPAGDRVLTDLARWALGRFEAVGLEVPPIEVHMHRDQTPCLGHRGLFHAVEGRIDVCTDDELVVLHELAHAWNHVNTSEETKAAYVSSGDFVSWDAPGTKWADRASEDAADTMAWALIESPIENPTPDGPLARTNERFRLLTGIDAPRIVWGQVTTSG